MRFSINDLLKEVVFKTSRSGGKGGQHVNKVESKVELHFNIRTSMLFNENEKRRLIEKLSSRLIHTDVVQIITEEERSQLRNKERGVAKLAALLVQALKIEKQRKASKPGRAAVEKRLKSKLSQSIKKINRSKPSWD